MHDIYSLITVLFLLLMNENQENFQKMIWFYVLKHDVQKKIA